MPPEGWAPPFAVDIEKFLFTPRVQKLNELEAKSRCHFQFMEGLAKFWHLQVGEICFLLDPKTEKADLLEILQF